MMDSTGSLLLAYALALGCASAPPPMKTPEAARRAAPAAPTASAPSAADKAVVPAPDRSCPRFDVAALEPLHPPADTRTLALSLVFPQKEPRRAGATTRTFELGRVPFDTDPRQGDRAGTHPVGLGWEGLSEKWVGNDVSPRVAASLAIWARAASARSDQLRRGFLLDTRANVLRAAPLVDTFMLGCVTAARADATRAAGELKRAGDQEETALLGVLDATAKRTASEDFLLAYFLAERTPGVPGDIAALARPLALFGHIADDTSANGELRARAAEQTARLYLGRRHRDEGAAALRRVLTLSKDPDLRIETMMKLADLAEDVVTREKLLSDLVAALDKKGGGWRLSLTLANLAEVRLERGELELARDVAARCGRTSTGEFAGEPDPWSCAPTLAAALGELGGAPDGIDVPLSFLGPLARELMSGAIDRKDRALIVRVGEMLLARFPEAAEAPQVIDMLASVIGNEAKAVTLRQRRARDYGPKSPWFAAQRARLAPKLAGRELDAALTRLVEVALRRGSPAPTGADGERAELEARLEQVLSLCDVELARAKKPVDLAIDTTGPVPRASVRGAPAPVTECLERGVRSRFRSLGPTAIRVALPPR